MLRQDLNKKSKARVKIVGLLYPNIFLINNQHSLKSYQFWNIEIFFRLTTFFFQEQKFFFQETTFVQFFMYCKAKKNFGVIRKILKIFDFQKSLSKLGPNVEDFNSS